jgi:iron complex outermembrane recepter protein
MTHGERCRVVSSEYPSILGPVLRLSKECLSMPRRFIARFVAVATLASLGLAGTIAPAQAQSSDPPADAGSVDGGPSNDNREADAGPAAQDQDASIPPQRVGATGNGGSVPSDGTDAGGPGASAAPVESPDDGGVPPGRAADDAGAASPEAQSDLGVVTVTAQRRVNTVQKTPIAITAFSQDAIQQQKISTFRDLSGRVPGLLAPLTSTALTTQTYSMRGIGEIDTYPEPSVAVYVDDVYLARTVGSLYDTPDLERVEVLRGPQGTLYGRNSAAGAIRFITKDPTAERTASLSVTLGNYGNVDVRGRASAGILANDALDASVSVVRHQTQGYTYDIPLAQWVNKLDLWVARTKVKSQVTERFSITVSGDAMWDRSTASYYTPVNQPNGVPSGDATDPSLSWSDTVPLNQTTVYGGSVTLKYDLTDALTLKSVTAVRGMHGPIYYDNDGTTYIKGDSYAGFDENYETEELSVNGDYDRLNFVGGLYFFDELFHNDRLNQAAASPLNDVGIIQHVNSRLYTQSYAAFGQADYKITDELTATAGARFTADIRSFKNVGHQQNGVPLVYPLPGNFNPSLFDTLFTAGSTSFVADAPQKTFSAFTPKLGVQYQLTPGALAYASFSQGFKSGGYDLRATTLNGSVTPYQPQTITAYEVGWKSSFLKNHVTANLAAFYNQVSDLQVRATSPGALGTPVNSLINTGDAHTYGGEVEIAVNPVHGLTVGGSGAFLKTAYDTFTATLPANVAGRTTLIGLDFPLAPTWQADGYIDYRLPLPVPGTWRIGGDVPYESGHYTDIYDTPQLRVRPQAFVNGTVNYTSQDERWSAGVSTTNLLNLRRPQSGAYSPTNAGAYPNWYYAYNPPRFVNFFFTVKI